MLNRLHFANIPHLQNVLKRRTACGIKRHALAFAAVILAGPAILSAQVCLPTLFQVGAVAHLNPSGTSHQVLLRQSDGSYTAYEIPNTAPYKALRNVPDFQRQLRTCPNPEPTGFTNPGPDGIYAAMPSGGYLFVSTAPASDYSVYFVNATFFDHNMNHVSSSVVSIPDEVLDFTGYSPVLVADLNHDGNPDLILEQCTSFSSIFEGCAVAVMLADGHGSFAQPVAYTLPGTNGIGAIVAADVNGDGNVDLVMASTYHTLTSAAPLGIAVFLGKGDGTFQQEKVVIPGVNVLGLAVADLNHDGKPDLVFSTPTGSSSNPGVSLAVVLGAGDGTFSTPVSFPVNNTVFTSPSVAIGDLDGDGNEDIAVGGGSIFFGDGKGGFPVRRDYEMRGSGSIILTDFDGDGKTDIVFTDAGNSQIISAATLTVFFGDGGGKFAAPALIVPPGSDGVVPVALAAADFDADGNPDLLVTEASTIGVLKGNGDGTFAITKQYSFDPASGVANGSFLTAVTGDFNHDGKTDFAVVGSGPNNALIQVFLGNGDDTFQSSVSTPVAAEINAITVGDFNGDGIPDLAIAGGPYLAAGGNVQILLGNGDGTFRQGAQYPAGPGVSDIVAADFNGDGKLDLALANAGVNSLIEPLGGNVTILLGKGDGTFTAGAILPVMPSPEKPLTAGDFNRDGKIDLAVAETNYVAVLLGNGDGTFGAEFTYAASEVLLALDVNGDHVLDLLTGSGVMLGNGDGSFQPAIPINLGGQPVAGDFHRNGKVDLVAGDAILRNVSEAPSTLSVVSAASLQIGPLAPESLATAYGVNLASTTEASQTLPLVLGGTSVSVKDSRGTVRAAPLLYVSPHQVNFLVPAGTRIGPANVTVMNASVAQMTRALIVEVAPGLFVLNDDGLAAASAISVSPDGKQTIQNVFTMHNGSLIASPIDLGPKGEVVYLVLLGTGIRNASAAQTMVYVGGVTAKIVDFGPVPGIDGLDQVKVLVPRDGVNHRGNVQVELNVLGARANLVTVNIK